VIDSMDCYATVQVRRKSDTTAFGVPVGRWSKVEFAWFACDTHCLLACRDTGVNLLLVLN
jgi:hypothetical protein